jgi:hypothetical protein
MRAAPGLSSDANYGAPPLIGHGRIASLRAGKKFRDVTRKKPGSHGTMLKAARSQTQQASKQDSVEQVAGHDGTPRVASIGV